MATKQRRPPKANPKAAIQDWLTLVDPDGAFLTATELTATFADGFDPMDRDLRTELRARVADLDTADDPNSRRDLTRWLLGTALGWDDCFADSQRIPATATIRAAEHGVMLRPNYVLLDVDDANKVRVGVFAWPTGTPLDRRVDPTTSGDTWPASPVQRAETWCRESGTPLALVTDDHAWTLVWAPRGAPAASCRWTISDLADETILQAGLVSLLGARRFFAVSDDPKTGHTLERLFERAADAEAELTKGLGSSVRQSVELLVAATSRDDVAHDGKVLAGIAPTEVYESAVTVLMRLVFLLFAEERRLLPAEDPLWAESYSVLTLRDDLRQAATRDGIDALERRATAWHRLLATFRAVHGGVNHDRLTLPAYGGSLFDPARFPFLEGRRTPDHIIAGGVDLGPAPDAEDGPGRPVAIDDRTILAILDALLTVQVKSGRTRVAQRVSYKALDVEQIGHCYEGLLDHGAVPIQELALGLVGPDGNEPEIAIADLEAFGDDRDALCEWLSDKTRCNKQPSALAKLFDQEPEGVDLARLRVACGHNDDTVARVLPYWGLLRTDLRGLPIVLLPGSMFVSQTSTRRNMGAQYTTKALAEEVVHYALEPLVHDPGPQNEPEQIKWKLKTPAAILDLRVCDPAVGSGAILTAAGRYLADRLVESVIEYGPGEGPFASRLHDLATAATDEQTVLARREVVDHCLYGVDKNPVAAEMAKLSLWLTTMARERPFTFLDHAIQVGDSLLGITDIEQLRWLHLDPSARAGAANFETVALDLRLKEAVDLSRQLREMSVVTVRDAEEKRRLHEVLLAGLENLSVVADCVVGAGLSTVNQVGVSLADRLAKQLDRIRDALDEDRLPTERDAALRTLCGVAAGWLRFDLPDDIPVPWERQCMHWPLVFPEVFLEPGRQGFDAIVANPPFLGGKRISGAFGDSYRAHLVAEIAQGTSGSADLVAYFLLQMCSLSGSVGTLATNTLSQGDTREVGLDRLLAGGWQLHRAVKSEPWPNEANLEIAKAWLYRADWTGARSLNGTAIETTINASLERASRVTGNPERLAANADQSFIGSFVNGIGFVLSPDEATELIAQDASNADVVMPYLSGADLNDDPRQRPSRWVINFFDWPIERAQHYAAPFEIVERLVRPERAKVKRKAHREKWWIYGDKRPALYAKLSEFDRALAMTLVSKLALPAWVSTSQVIAHKCVVFPTEDPTAYGLLTSSVHWWWTVRWSSSLGGVGNINYSPSDVYETLPMPSFTDGFRRAVETASTDLDAFRADLMEGTQRGLTKTYNKVHDPAETDPSIMHLRELHVALDDAVASAYGWSDLALDHHHWETPQGMRFTISPQAKDEILDRLLEMNHERYAEEVAAGLHDKRAKKSTKKSSAKDANTDQGQLL